MISKTEHGDSCSGSELRAGRIFRPAHFHSGLTLIEILAVLLIVFILAVLLMGVISRLPGAADRVRCTGNLKALHVAFQNYMEDHQGVWPQEPKFDLSKPSDHTKFEAWWIKEMAPYGFPESGWQCPGVKRLGKLQDNPNQLQPRIHYIPTMFDKTPWKAKQHMMPWAIEIGAVHGSSPLALMPDGSVREYDQVVAETGQ